MLNSCWVRVDGQAGVGERGDGRVGGLPGPVHDVDRLAPLAQHERDLRRPLDRGPRCGVGGDDLPGGDGLVVGLADVAHLQPSGGELALGVGPAAADEVGDGVALGSLGDGQPDRGPSPEVGPGAGVTGQHDAGADLLVEGAVDLRREVAAREPLLGLVEGKRHDRRDRRPGARAGEEEPRAGRSRDDGEHEHRPGPPTARTVAGRRGVALRERYDGGAAVLGAVTVRVRVAAAAPRPGHRHGGGHGRRSRRRAGSQVQLGRAQGLTGPPQLDQEGARVHRPPVRVTVGREGDQPVEPRRHGARPGWRARARCCARAGRRRGWGCPR